MPGSIDRLDAQSRPLAVEPLIELRGAGDEESRQQLTAVKR
jgi:hypothetical protein